jgi:hypothetical protein
MSFDLVQIRKLAEAKEDQNWKFRQFLKTRRDLEPDWLAKQRGARRCLGDAKSLAGPHANALMNCHPEQREGSAVSAEPAQLQIPRRAHLASSG